MPGCYGMEMRRSAECTGTIQPPYYVTCVPTRAANHPSVFTITEKVPRDADAKVTRDVQVLLVGAFSVIVKTDGLFAALVRTQVT